MFVYFSNHEMKCSTKLNCYRKNWVSFINMLI